MLKSYVQSVGGFALGWVLISVLSSFVVGQVTEQPLDWGLLTFGVVLATVVFAIRWAVGKR
jgi:biotin transporter BioY